MPGRRCQNVNWLLDAGARPGQERKPILAVNNFYAMLRAVMSGLGIAALSDFMASEHTELVRVLPELTGPPIEAYFVYPEELRTSKRDQRFSRFSAAQGSREPAWLSRSKTMTRRIPQSVVSEHCAFCRRARRKFPVVLAGTSIFKHAMAIAEFPVVVSANTGSRDLCPGRGSSDPYVSQT